MFQYMKFPCTSTCVNNFKNVASKMINYVIISEDVNL